MIPIMMEISIYKMILTQNIMLSYKNTVTIMEMELLILVKLTNVS